MASMSRVLVTLAIVGLVGLATVSAVELTDLSYHDLPRQLNSWEAEVKASASTGTVDAFNSADETLDEFGSMNLLEEDSEMDLAVEDIERNIEFTAATDLPVEDFLQSERRHTADKVTDSEHKAPAGPQNNVFCAPSNAEVRHAAALAAHGVGSHVTVRDAGVQADIFLSHTVTPALDAATSLLNSATANIDMVSLTDEAQSEFDVVRDHVSSLAKRLQGEAKKSWASLNKWVKGARASADQRVASMESWAKHLRATATEDVEAAATYAEKQASKLAAVAKGALVCKKVKEGAVVRYFDAVPAPKCAPPSKDNVAYIVLRSNDRPNDWLANVETEHKPCNVPGCKGKVHSGFQTAYNSLSDRIMEAATNLVHSGKVSRFVITGHSMGGAMAVLGALHSLRSLPSAQVSLVTFGQPRVGDLEFAKAADKSLPGYKRVVTAFAGATCTCHSKAVHDFVTSTPSETAGFHDAGSEATVTCYKSTCATRCCPQAGVTSVDCHSMSKYVPSVLKSFH